MITSPSLSKAPLGAPLLARFTPSKPSKNFGACMIRYLSPTSCQTMQISICLKLGLSQNEKTLSVQMEANGLLPIVERVTVIPCG